jgi:hypothetical protein
MTDDDEIFHGGVRGIGERDGDILVDRPAMGKRIAARMNSLYLAVAALVDRGARGSRLDEMILR